MFECKCGELITTYDQFYEQNGKFKFYIYVCPRCQSCKVMVHYCNGKVDEIKGFMK